VAEASRMIESWLG